MTKKSLRFCWAVLGTLILGALLIGSLTGMVHALPPRPTAFPTVTATPPSPPGGSIELRLQISSAWAWDEIPWQSLWTVVQWQDPAGAWHDVEGWRGTLDRVAMQEGGSVLGLKVWWVGEADLGTGPFRWTVTRGQGGALLAVSAPFDLPDAAGRRVAVEAALTP